jgi:2,3-bisphosphoglycerate-independent phosphoglycerate mutase
MPLPLPHAQRFALIILDGWGLAPNTAVSAIDAAHKPYFDSLWARYKHATLNTTGLAVGLPEGQMGNSEVGHMNLGAGRIVYQELVRIGLAVKDGSLFNMPAIEAIAKYLEQNPAARLHLTGLVSDGGVHSHIDHLLALIGFFGNRFPGRVFIQAITDGRDCAPNSGKGFITRTEHACAAANAKIASVTGRYFAMDRDKRWERVEKAYNAIVHGIGTESQNIIESIQVRYDAGQTDEFLEPIIATGPDSKPLATIADGDAVLFFNFRTDRGRELTKALVEAPIEGTAMVPLKLNYTTLTRYDESFKNVHVVFEKDNLESTLGQVLSEAGRTQLRTAETEKYPHVTFFFSGGREEPFEGEERIMCPSPKVATYDLQPEMSAGDITDAVLTRLKNPDANPAPDFICLNYANTDMVGHTGVFDAARRACEAVDQNLARLVPRLLELGYHCWLLADHGNSDNMINADGSPNTQHSTNPVPSMIVGPGFESDSGVTISDGVLGDVAPTLLHILGIDPPPTMSGTILVR